MTNREPSIPGVALLRRLCIVVPIFSIVIGFGAFGYKLLEDEISWVDAIYQSVVTISTVGFGEVHPLGDDSRIFTIVLILLGVSAFTYTFSTLGEYIVASEFRGLVRARRMQKKNRRTQKLLHRLRLWARRAASSCRAARLQPIYRDR
jgi:voltage-gated potassium channel